VFSRSLLGSVRGAETEGITGQWGQQGECTVALEINNTTEGFAQETLQSFKMNWEGQRLYSEAYHEAEKDHGAYDENDAVWDRMDAAEAMQQAADDMTNDVEARARAAGVNITDMLNLVDQHLNGTVDLVAA
jgi:hypothetical protein